MFSFNSRQLGGFALNFSSVMHLTKQNSKKKTASSWFKVLFFFFFSQSPAIVLSGVQIGGRERMWKDKQVLNLIYLWVKRLKRQQT